MLHILAHVCVCVEAMPETSSLGIFRRAPRHACNGRGMPTSARLPGLINHPPILSNRMVSTDGTKKKYIELDDAHFMLNVTCLVPPLKRYCPSNWPQCLLHFLHSFDFFDKIGPTFHFPIKSNFIFIFTISLYVL